jgi:predicted enzyme related to lactoylglutathione lyase
LWAAKPLDRIGFISPLARMTERMGDNEMKIKLTSVQVDDQDKALRFYAEVLGFAKKADFSSGSFRWLTVS